MHDNQWNDGTKLTKQYKPLSFLHLHKFEWDMEPSKNEKKKKKKTTLWMMPQSLFFEIPLPQKKKNTLKHNERDVAESVKRFDVN